MELSLKRVHKDNVCTQGVLFNAAGVFECYTLELPEPIPAGRYKVALTFSHRVEQGTLWSPSSMLPELLDVPGHTAIRIHAGNTVANTAGCILVGLTTINDAIFQSRDALTKLMSKLTGSDWITISDDTNS